MTLVVEPMAEVSSAAFVFSVPAGAAWDPPDRTGTATVLTDVLFRGAGQMDNRTLNERLDGLGLHRQTTVGSLHSNFAGTLVADNLLEVLDIYSDILLRAHLPADEFELCRALALQSLDSLDDDPRQKIGMLLAEQYLPKPLGRFVLGKRDELQALTAEEVKAHWQERFSPQGTILAVAGAVDFEQLKAFVAEKFGDWQGTVEPKPAAQAPQKRRLHEANQGEQVHVGVMYPSVTYTDTSYYDALAVVSVLSGGMGSRLFTEVREKRGLCYAVMAAHRVTGPYGAVQCYLGSTPDRAQEALDVLLGELTRLPEGISDEELDRAKVGLRASLVMQGESSTARSLGCANDYYHLGRVRSLSEIEQAVKSLEVGEVVAFVKSHEPKDFTVVTIGPKELTAPQ